MGRIPWRRMHSWTSGKCSLEWIWSRMPRSRQASERAARVSGALPIKDEQQTLGAIMGWRAQWATWASITSKISGQVFAPWPVPISPENRTSTIWSSFDAHTPAPRSDYPGSPPQTRASVMATPSSTHTIVIGENPDR